MSTSVFFALVFYPITILTLLAWWHFSEMTYNVLMGTLNPTHSLTWWQEGASSLEKSHTSNAQRLSLGDYWETLLNVESSDFWDSGPVKQELKVISSSNGGGDDSGNHVSTSVC